MREPEEIHASSSFITQRYVESPEDCFFYHTIELPGLGLIRGHWDLRGRFDEYVGGVEVSNKSVLDVGTATGFLSFEAERRGAGRIVSHDMSDVREQKLIPFKDKIYFKDRDAWAAEYGAEIERWKNAYWLCHRLFGSRAEVFYGDVLTLPASLGEFDVAIIGSVLEHLPDQVSALASVARLVRERLVIVTPLIETEERIARFEPRADNPAYDFTWWTYSLGLYREVLAILGFRIERISRAEYHYDYGDLWLERSTLVAVRD